MTEDYLGFQAGINFYAYVRNNPVNARDPSGLDVYGVTVGFDVGFILPIPIPFTNIVIPVSIAFTGSVTVAFDTNGDVKVVATPEAGLGTPGFDVFGRGVWGPGDGITVDSLLGGAPAVSGSIGPVSGSVSFTADGPIYGLGIGVPAGPPSISVTYGYGFDITDVISGGGINTGGASGGFILYPSKPNLNMMNRVYNK